MENMSLSRKKPAKSGSEYFNYKKFSFIVLMSVVDAQYCFLFIDVDQPGADSDSGV